MSGTDSSDLDSSDLESSDDDLPVLPGFRQIGQRRRELAAELAAHRRAAALSQGEVAERMGTSQPAIARLEAGEVDVRLSTVERYAAAVGLSLELRLGPAPHASDAQSEGQP